MILNGLKVYPCFSSHCSPSGINDMEYNDMYKFRSANHGMGQATITQSWHNAIFIINILLWIRSCCREQANVCESEWKPCVWLDVTNSEPRRSTPRSHRGSGKICDQETAGAHLWITVKLPHSRYKYSVTWMKHVWNSADLVYPVFVYVCPWFLCICVWSFVVNDVNLQSLN